MNSVGACPACKKPPRPISPRFHRFVSRPTLRRPTFGSVNVPRISPGTAPLHDSLGGGAGRQAAMLRDHLLQRRVDVLRHPLRIAADVDAGAALEPIPKLGAPLLH